MASRNFLNELPELAWQYMNECELAVKEFATNKGAVEIKARRIATINYFFLIWLPKHSDETINRQTYYNWFKSKQDGKAEIVNYINDLFEALAESIVANEGNGIFYAKNKMGWTDKVQSDINQNVQLFTIDPLANATDNLPSQNSITE